MSSMKERNAILQELRTNLYKDTANSASDQVLPSLLERANVALLREEQERETKLAAEQKEREIQEWIAQVRARTDQLISYAEKVNERKYREIRETEELRRRESRRRREERADFQRRVLKAGALCLALYLAGRFFGSRRGE